MDVSRRSTRWWVGHALWFTAMLGCVVAALLDPDGPGALLSPIAALFILPAIAFGPLLRGARPRHIWAMQTAGGLCLLLSPLAESTQTDRLGPLRLVDIAYFSGLTFLTLWLVLLARHVGHPRDQHVALDAAAFTVGSALVSWSAVLAPLVGGTGFPAGLVGMIYPTWDLLLLVLAVHISRRLRRRVVAAHWLIGSLASEFVIDLLASTAAVVAPELHEPLLAFSLLPLAGLAVAATDPSVVHLSPPPAGADRTPSAGHPIALILFTAPPILLSTAIPPHGVIDTTVRTILTGALLTLLFIRLSRMLHTLATTEAESRRRATHDPLTGLLNRAALLERLQWRLETDRAQGRLTAIVFFDCDGFKRVNDTWGHAAGDTLLCDIARSLPAHLGPEAILARLGGDEFVVVDTVPDAISGRALAERVRRFFDRPLAILPGRRHSLTPSVGLAVVSPDDEDGPEALLARADAAMYTAKEAGRGRVAVYDDDLAHRTHSQARAGDRLAATLVTDPFEIHFMPIKGGPGYETTVGWEALARWVDVELGRVSPEVFIPLAERMGLQDDLGRLLLRRACRDAALLLADAPTRAAGHHLAVHVNVSPTQLRQIDFADQVDAALGEAGLPGSRLRLEVTETLLVDEGPDVLEVLQRVRALGVQICLDDFGTGYASLATLLRLPIDCVKLDRSIAEDVGRHAESNRRAAALLSLIESVGVTEVIAEGVETELQATTLLDLGCPLAQGWLFGQPRPAADLLGETTPPQTTPTV